MKKTFARLKSPKVLRRIIMGVIVVLVVGGYLYFQNARDRIKIDNSVVSAPVITINPGAPGKLKELNAVEGHMVKTGDTLAIVGTETLRAQTDGLIISASNQVGGVINPTLPFIQMIQPEQMRIDGTIDENKGLNSIKVGQVVSFTVDALPGQTFWGYVDEIAPSAKQTQLSFSISSERPTQQFDVYARFDAINSPQIKKGMSAKMVVYTKQ